MRKAFLNSNNFVKYSIQKKYDDKIHEPPSYGLTVCTYDIFV